MSQANSHGTPLRDSPDQPPRPVGRGKALNGMWWVAWRQHRTQLAISLAFVAAVATVLVIFRLRLVDRLQELLGADFTECVSTIPAGGPVQCPERVFGAIYNEFGPLWGLLVMGMLALPLALGAFVGAPLFAREFEQHTQVYALTQSVGRLRWWTCKVTVAGVPVVLGMIGLGLLMDWAGEPFADFIARPMDTPNFQILGIIPAALTGLTIAVAVTAGIVLRSTVIALVLSIIVAGALVVALSLIRPHLLTPERVLTPVESTSSTFYPSYRSWYLDSGYLDATGDPVDFNGYCPAIDNARPSSDAEDVNRLWVECQRAQGITDGYVDYLPADRRTTLQLTVTGICAVLTVLFLAAGAFRLCRRVL